MIHVGGFRWAGVEVPYTLSMDFVEETANFCKALADAITQREAAFGHFDVAHGHEWPLDAHWNVFFFFSRLLNLHESSRVYQIQKGSVSGATGSGSSHK